MACGFVDYQGIVAEVCDIGAWVHKIHTVLEELDVKQSPEYQAKLKNLSLILIRCTEFIKSKRPSSEDSSAVRAVLSFGGELLFHEVNQAKVKDLQDALCKAQNKLTSEVAFITLNLNCANTRKMDLKGLLPDLFNSFRADIDLHLGEFKTGSRGWLLEVRYSLHAKI